VDNLAELLIEGTRSRIDSVDKNVIALSGGLDSRTVAACLNKLKAPFYGATFLDYFGIVRPDIQYAEIIAQNLDIVWKFFRAKRATGKEVLELLRVKDGLNFLGLSFSVPLIKSMIDFYGSGITFFTGDGGDRVLRDIRPVGNIHNVEHLLSYIITNNRMIPIDIVSAITGMNKADFISRMKNYLMEYDEENMKMKYLQFIFSERCPSWYFQGEDRNRAYLHPVTPFYDIKFFKYSMNLPDSIKHNFKLYRKVMVKISPEVAAVNNAEWGFPITSRKLGLYCAARRIYFAMPTQIRNFVQLRHKFSRKISPYYEGSTVMKCFRRQLETCSSISDYLCPGKIENNIGKIDKAGFEHLFTLTSLIEDIKGGKSSIEEYSGSDML
jgi:asparagine synthase (glutamine-hydrolysing)